MTLFSPCKCFLYKFYAKKWNCNFWSIKQNFTFVYFVIVVFGVRSSMKRKVTFNSLIKNFTISTIHRGSVSLQAYKKRLRCRANSYPISNLKIDKFNCIWKKVIISAFFLSINIKVKCCNNIQLKILRESSVQLWL